MKNKVRFRIQKGPLGRWFVWATDSRSQCIALLGTRPTQPEAIEYAYEFINRPPSWRGWMRQP